MIVYGVLTIVHVTVWACLSLSRFLRTYNTNHIWETSLESCYPWRLAPPETERTLRSVPSDTRIPLTVVSIYVFPW